MRTRQVVDATTLKTIREANRQGRQAHLALEPEVQEALDGWFAMSRWREAALVELIERVTEIDVEALPVFKSPPISEKIRPKVRATVGGSVEKPRLPVDAAPVKLYEALENAGEFEIYPEYGLQSVSLDPRSKERSTHRHTEPAMVLASCLEGEQATERQGSLEQCFTHPEVHSTTAGAVLWRNRQACIARVGRLALKNTKFRNREER